MSKRHRAARNPTLHDAFGTEPATALQADLVPTPLEPLSLDPLEEARVRARAGDGLGSLAACRVAAVDLDSVTRRAVRLARADGATWEQVAVALGLASKQAAHARYGTG